MTPAVLKDEYIRCIAACFARQEGALDGKWQLRTDQRIGAIRTKNPGNIMQASKTKPPTYSLRVYNTWAEGWTALMELIRRVGVVRREPSFPNGMSLYQFLEGVRVKDSKGKQVIIYGGYASSVVGNDSATYVKNVANWLKIDGYGRSLSQQKDSYNKVPTEAILSAFK